MDSMVKQERRSMAGERGIVSPKKLAHFVLMTRDMKQLRDWRRSSSARFSGLVADAVSREGSCVAGPAFRASATKRRRTKSAAETARRAARFHRRGDLLGRLQRRENLPEWPSPSSHLHRDGYLENKRAAKCGPFSRWL
jgi:hypothetical protein